MQKLTMCVMLVLFPALASSQEATTEDLAAERATRLELMQRSVGEYVITIGVQADPVVLRKTPVLRFTNPIRRTADGGLFLWEAEGRPVALTCIYPGQGGTWEHEFQSLTEQALSAARSGQVVWRPLAGVRFNDVPNVAAPAKTIPGRRRELGAISRRFTARLLGWGQANPKNDELRLQDNPVYRWGDANGPVTDGALFLFGEATDPEVALIIEAHRRDDSVTWKYAAARVTSGELTVQLDGKEVWRVPTWDQDPRPEQPYLTRFRQAPPANE